MSLRSFRWRDLAQSPGILAVHATLVHSPVPPQTFGPTLSQLLRRGSTGPISSKFTWLHLKGTNFVPRFTAAKSKNNYFKEFYPSLEICRIHSVHRHGVEQSGPPGCPSCRSCPPTPAVRRASLKEAHGRGPTIVTRRFAVWLCHYAIMCQLEEEVKIPLRHSPRRACGPA